MKAAYFRRHGGPEVLEVGEAPEPVVAAGTVVVRVRAVSLNHLDLWTRRGIPGLNLEMPHIGGSDAAGIVESVGADVEGWAPGDRVAINGALWCGLCDFCQAGDEALCRRFRVLGEHVRGSAAELVRVPAANLFRIPDDFPFERAAAAPLVFQTAWRALTTRGRLRDGETLLVTGASGGVSTAGIQVGRHLGARVLAITSGAENAARVSDLGADVVIDRLAEDVDARIHEATAGRGVDVVLDSVGEALWKTVTRAVGPDGRIVVYGATTGPKVTLHLAHVFWKQQSVIGSTMSSRREFEEVMSLVVDGTLEPVLDDVLPLERIREAHERLEAGRVFGKLVLTP
ncbi:MAG TPA: zinc-binding dehydrogenase [Gemmatimonadota bacterium]|nr:zinc-binding dehydrogenase [Gemmatimonadota bacterium]